MRRLPAGSTTATSPGGITVVASRSSINAGPPIRAPDPSA
jgi:hypothetical protein